MSCVEGYLNTLTHCNGHYLGWVFEGIPVEVQVTNPALIAALENPREDPMEYMVPIVEVTNDITAQIYELDDITDVSISRDTESEQDRYSVTLADGARWSPDGTEFPGLLAEGHPSRTVRIYLEFSHRGTVYKIKIFTGTITRSSGEFTAGHSSWTITGSNLAEKLRYADGTLDEIWGTRAYILGRLLQSAGIKSFYFAFPEKILFVNENYEFVPAFKRTILAQTALGSITNIFRGLPGFDFHIDSRGQFIARKPRTGTPSAWTYDANKNLNSIRDARDASGVQTQVRVIGGHFSAVVMYMDPVAAARYGTRLGGLSSWALLTRDAAIEAAKAQIAKTLRGTKSFEFDAITPNPAMDPGDIVTVNDSTREDCGFGSRLNNAPITVRRITFQWTKSNPGASFSFGGDRT